MESLKKIILEHSFLFLSFFPRILTNYHFSAIKLFFSWLFLLCSYTSFPTNTKKEKKMERKDLERNLNNTNLTNELITSSQDIWVGINLSLASSFLSSLFPLFSSFFFSLFVSLFLCLSSSRIIVLIYMLIFEMEGLNYLMS